jgi:hypothetical protein
MMILTTAARIHQRAVLLAVIAYIALVALAGCLDDVAASTRAQNVSAVTDAATESVGSTAGAASCRAMLLVKPVPQNDLWLRVGQPVDVAPTVGASDILTEPLTDDRGDPVYLSIEVIDAPAP